MLVRKRTFLLNTCYSSIQNALSSRLAALCSDTSTNNLLLYIFALLVPKPYNSCFEWRLRYNLSFYSIYLQNQKIIILKMHQHCCITFTMQQSTYPSSFLGNDNILSQIIVIMLLLNNATGTNVWIIMNAFLVYMTSMHATIKQLNTFL